MIGLLLWLLPEPLLPVELRFPRLRFLHHILHIHDVCACFSQRLGASSQVMQYISDIADGGTPPPFQRTQPC